MLVAELFIGLCVLFFAVPVPWLFGAIILVKFWDEEAFAADHFWATWITGIVVYALLALAWAIGRYLLPFFK